MAQLVKMGSFCQTNDSFKGFSNSALSYGKWICMWMGGTSCVMWRHYTRRGKIAVLPTLTQSEHVLQQLSVSSEVEKLIYSYPMVRCYAVCCETLIQTCLHYLNSNLESLLLVLALLGLQQRSLVGKRTFPSEFSSLFPILLMYVALVMFFDSSD